MFLQGKALRVQLDLRRYGESPMGAWGESPPHPTHNYFLLSRFRIYSKQSALESLAVRAWGGLGRGCPFRIPTYSPLCWQLCHYADPGSSPTAVLTAGPTEDPAAADHHAHH